MIYWTKCALVAFSIAGALCAEGESLLSAADDYRRRILFSGRIQFSHGTTAHLAGDQQTHVPAGRYGVQHLLRLPDAGDVPILVPRLQRPGRTAQFVHVSCGSI